MHSVNLLAPVNQMGYGQTGFNYLRCLVDAGIDVNFFNIGSVDYPGGEDVINSTWVRKTGKKPNKTANCLKIWHQNDLYEFVGKGKHIGFPIFELNRFTQEEISSLNHCDEIVVCSKWAERIIKDNGINKPTHVVPLGFNPLIFKPASILNGPTRFFNGGKWELRKGHDFILNCFNKAFIHSDNVQLVMLSDNPFPQGRGSDWVKLYKESKLGYKITFVPRQSTQENVYYIMKQMDCGLFPARAEGWNLELLEVLACGKHVITTNYSGHTEFCTQESCRLIEITSLESANDGIWFNGFGSWARLDKDQEDEMIAHMREIHKLKQSGELKQNHAGIIQANNFTWEKSTRKLIEAIK